MTNVSHRHNVSQHFTQSHVIRVGRLLMRSQGCQKGRRLLGVPAAGYHVQMIEEIKSSQPEVKASKSDKWLRSYGHFKICIVSHQLWVFVDVFDIDNTRRRRLLIAA